MARARAWGTRITVGHGGAWPLAWRTHNGDIGRPTLETVSTIDPDGYPVNDRVRSAPRAPAGGPLPPSSLAVIPIGAIALMLGYVAGSAQARRTPGRICTLVDELRRRGVYPDIISALDPELAQRIHLLYQADRGQYWRVSGHRPP